MLTGFQGVVTGKGSVGGSGGYRLDIDANLPDDFVRSFEPQEQGQGWVYALYLIEGTRSKTVAKLVSMLPGQRRRLQEQIAKQVDRSKQRFESVLLTLGIPASLINPVVGLIAAAAQALVTVIVNQIVKRFSETSLTPWTIWHTVLMGSDRVPVSIFTIAGRDATTPPLCRLVKGTGGQWTADDKYAGYLAAEQGASRFMIGETAIPTGGIDAGWFDLAAQTGQPLAWQEPLQTRGGFRILLPHLDRSLDAWGGERLDKDRYKKLAAKSKKVYVSAIRADVHLHFEADPWFSSTAVRRPRGPVGHFKM